VKLMELTPKSIGPDPPNELLTKTWSRVKLFTGFASSSRLIVKYPKGPVFGSPVSCVTVSDWLATSSPEAENDGAATVRIVSKRDAET
jgi:hypothetical protein